MQNDLIGKQLGDYKIVSILGKGGMAQVYKGYDENLDRYAAVKVIDPGTVPNEEDAEYRERFSREARAIARLNHARIVGVYQFGSTESLVDMPNLYYMAMVFIDGRDLRQVLKEFNRRERRMTHAQVLRIMQDMAEALDYAHQQGVIHRDVKPSNIMVTADGHAVLTDFGLALRTQEGTLGNTFGSVHYIAPEQAVNSAQATAQSDLYSLGVVLFEMLAGKVPFDDNSAMSVALKHISDPPPPLSSFNPDIAPEVESVVLKALDKEPARRYASGEAFVKALARAFAAGIDEETHDLQDDTNPYVSLEDIDAKAVAARSQAAADADSEPQVEDATQHPRRTREMQQADLGGFSAGRVDIEAPTVPTDPSMQKALLESRMKAQSKQRSRRGLLIGALLLIVAVLAVLLLVLSGLGSDDGGDAAVVAAAQTNTASALAAIDQPDASATDTPTELPPTDTPTELPPTETPTELPPTDTPTELPPTETPTELPPTDTPTELPPTDTPTELPPTETPTIVGTPLIDAVDNDEPALLLRYDGRTLVAYNRSNQRIDISGLVFVGNGGSFQAREWDTGVGEISRIPTQICYQVWSTLFVNLPDNAFPAEICASRRGFRQTARTFWIDNSEGATFEVRRNNVVLAECPAVSEDNEADNRCLVPLDGSDG